MAGEIYYVRGTPLVFQDSSGDVVITLANLGFGAGRISARYDAGAGAKPAFYVWQGIFQYATAPQIGEGVEVYAFPSDGTYMDGTLGTSDAALSSDKRRNGLLMGTVIADTTSTNTDTIKTGIVQLPTRYFSIGVWNGSSGDNLRNNANSSKVILTPYYAQVQS